MVLVQVSSTAKLFCTWVTNSGEAATIDGTPTISIWYLDGDDVINLINAAEMMQVGGSSYYYSWSVPPQVLRSYLIRYSADYDTGQTVIAEDTALALSKAFFQRSSGGAATHCPWGEKEKKILVEAVDKLQEEFSSLIKNRRLMFRDEQETSFSELQESLENGLKELDFIKEVVLKSAPTEVLEELADGRTDNRT